MPVDLTFRDGAAVLTLNRPEALNALSFAIIEEIGAKLDEVARSDARVLLVTGAGEKAFIAGADIAHMSNFTPLEAREFSKNGQDILFRLEALPIPVIGCVNGFALGGGLELAMTCDIRIAAEHARLGQPEVNIGRMPGGGGTQRLPRFVPRAIAAEILLTGESINAQEAYRIGLVNMVVPPDQLMPAAKQIAETICKKGPLGIRAAKEAMIRGYSMTLEEGLQLETELGRSVMVSKDFAEGRKAFMEKRTPEYKGE